MRARTAVLAAALVAAAVSLHSCGGSRHVPREERRKEERLAKDRPQAGLRLAREADLPELEYRKARRDTLVVRDGDREMLIMKAVKDEETGDMVAADVLDAAVVTARFRNVAERRGRVDLRFQVTVPASMRDRAWQLRLYPDMYIMEDSVRLDPVIVTGEGYRHAQLRGYEQYRRFVSRIVEDETVFIDIDQLEIFLERNIPDVFAFKSDSSEVSDEVFFSYFGVSERQAVEHYSDTWRRRRNRRRIAGVDRAWERYVRAPIVTEGIRLDTVVRNADGDFVYDYVQTIATRPRLRKVDIVLSGDVWEQDRRIYRVPRGEPLTFYISSLSGFADPSERYLRRVVERRAEANASYRIEFGRGRSDVDPSLGDNRSQLALVEGNLRDLMSNGVFDLDSVVVSAASSPEGSWALNGALSRRRGESVAALFRSYVARLRAEAEADAEIVVGEDGSVARIVREVPDVRFVSRSVPENWDLLDRLVDSDARLSAEEKARYAALSAERDPDRREALLAREPFYRYMYDSLYPATRVVDFGFRLHRRGMVKDTVQTTELDTLYMRGVRCLQEMEWDEAIRILGPYQDYNAAVAYMGGERNASAALILEGLPRTARVDYLMAVLKSRLGDEGAAVQYYLDACRKDPSYVHRGNLDPEISQLIRLYGLDRRDEEEEDVSGLLGM